MRNRHETKTATAANGQTVGIRTRRTSIDGQRGWVWEWTDGTIWCEPNGPYGSRQEAEDEARAAIAGWPSV